MPSEVILPRVDMDMTTGKIAKWFVEPGAAVTKGQPLFEIETDKAAMEIEAPATGTIRDLADASGTDIPVGSVVAWIFAEGEAAAAAKPAPADADRCRAEDERFDSALPPLSQEASAAEAPVADVVSGPDRPRATPMARRLARAQNIDLGQINGTGPRGRIQARDVDTAASTPAIRDQNPAAPAPSIPIASVSSMPARPVPSGLLNLVRLREGQGRPTLLIHGFGADANTWRPFLSGRTSDRPVFALDLPGHGGSPLGTVTTFATLVDIAEAALATSGLGAIDLVGHSLGAAVSATLAARGGLDVRSLLLLSPAGLGPDVNGAFVRGFLGARTEASLTPWMHELVTDPAVIGSAFVRATLAARQDTDLVARQRRIAEAVFADDTQSFSIRPDLARLTIPSRMVFGTADKIIPAKHARGLPGLVALHLLPNVGHMPHLEARSTIATILDDMTA